MLSGVTLPQEPVVPEVGCMCCRGLTCVKDCKQLIDGSQAQKALIVLDAPNIAMRYGQHQAEGVGC